ncbi:hypothetical protein D3C80_1942170 [compost metagenome]
MMHTKLGLNQRLHLLLAVVRIGFRDDTICGSGPDGTDHERNSFDSAGAFDGYHIPFTDPLPAQTGGNPAG